MADFYVKYGSKGAKLIAQHRIGNLNIMLHQISDHRFVLSKNRKILLLEHDLQRAITRFNYAVAFEASDLFNT